MLKDSKFSTAQNNPIKNTDDLKTSALDQLATQYPDQPEYALDIKSTIESPDTSNLPIIRIKKL